MTRSTVRPTLKLPDVHSTGIERDENKHSKEDKRTYTQVYLTQTRIEGIERWRAAVYAALQPAKDGDEELETETKMSQWSADGTVRQQKMEAVRNIPVEMLEEEPTVLVEGVKQRRRGRQRELWKGLRNMFFVF